MNLHDKLNSLMGAMRADGLWIVSKTEDESSLSEAEVREVIQRADNIIKCANEYARRNRE